jgi:nucleotide-binding universal stress UspA family protein
MAGRSHVPVIDTAAVHGADPDHYRVIVPISNPRIESHLVDFAATKENATVHVVHIVQKPSRSGRFGRIQREQVVSESDELLEGVREAVRQHEVGCETSTVVSHRSFQEIFDIAEREHADLVVMGWGEEGLWSAGRAERPLSELTDNLSSDFIVLKDRGLDTFRLTPVRPVASSSQLAALVPAVSGKAATALLGAVRGSDLGFEALDPAVGNAGKRAALGLPVGGVLGRFVNRFRMTVP